MRILFLSQYYPPEPGAPAARISELARAWARDGHDVTVLTGFPNHPTGVIPEKYRGVTFREESDQGVRVLRTFIYAAANKGKLRRSLAYLSYAASAALFGQWFAKKPDVLIATSPQLLCGAAGAIVATLKNVPFVLEVRDLWPESIVAVGALPKEHPVIRGLTLIEETLYRRARHIVLVTDSFKTNLEKRGIAESKLSVVKNGVDLARFVPESQDTKLRAELRVDPPGKSRGLVIGYVGTHGMAHGLDTVLDVAKDLPQHTFIFAGDGAERARLEERKKTEAIDNVRFLGSLSRDRMPQVYATCDLLIVPLRKTELFTTVIPSKMFEIFAMERPIVLSVDGEARAIAEASGGAIFSPPEDRDSMREAIERLAKDPALRERMGKAARAYVLREFDRNALAKTYLEILERVVA